MNTLNTRHSAERFAQNLRWILLLGFASISAEALRTPPVFAVFALLAVSSGVSQYLLLNEKKFPKTLSFVAFLSRLDVLVFVSTPLLSQLAGSAAWALAIPSLVLDGLVRRERKASWIIGALSMAACGLALFSATHQLSSLMIPTGLLAASVAFGVCLSNFHQRDEILRVRDRRLNAVLNCGGALADNGDLQQMMLLALKSSVEETKAQCGYVMLTDQDNPNLIRPEVAYSIDGSFSFPEELEMGGGLSGYVAKTGQPISIGGNTDQFLDGVIEGVQSAACVPLISRGYRRAGQPSIEQGLGVLTLIDQKDPSAFASDDMELLRTMSSLMAVAVSSARMEERRRATFLQTLESLATALEARDEYTRGHSQRVCELSIMIGERMGFSSDALEELRIGTILHDIGKIGVPDAILNKRARLTDEEFLVMKTHPVIGYEICKPLMLSEGVLMIIRNHHEKLDGSGYPDGLKGGELPLSLRIVCVADAFDAMSSRRPYRAVMEIATVLGELSRGAGTQFDSVVVENLKELLNNGRLNELYSQYWEDPAEPRAA